VPASGADSLGGGRVGRAARNDRWPGVSSARSGAGQIDGESTGDLYVTVRVEVPTGLDARTHELVRQLARLMPVETRTALERYRGGAE